MCPFSCEKRAALKAAAILTDVLTKIKDQVFTWRPCEFLPEIFPKSKRDVPRFCLEDVPY
jgi:hypothetical protein